VAKPQPQPARATEGSLAWWAHALAILALSLPFLALGWLTNAALFLGDQNARVLSSALLANSQGRIDAALTVYPPLPMMVAMVVPSVLTLVFSAALCAGATMWVLWRLLAQTRQSGVTRLALLLAVAVLPATVFLGTQSFSRMATLLLFVVAWGHFLSFTRERTTWNGFAAGLVLGLAFYLNIYAVVFGVIYAVLALFYVPRDANQTFREWLPGALTASIVIIFPTAMAFGTWVYLSWVTTGDGLAFVADATYPLFASGDPNPQWFADFNAVLTQALVELAQTPVYLVVGLMTLVHTPKRLLVWILPVALLILVRSAGLLYANVFAVVTMLVFALPFLWRRASPLWGVALILAAGLQIYANVAVIQPQGEVRDWLQVAFTLDPLPSDARDADLARQLRNAPPRSILADDRRAYQLIARAGTGAPFLTPDDVLFDLALSLPEQYADYLLMADAPGFAPDAVGERFAAGLPPGYILDFTWEGWRIYRRGNAFSLNGGA